MNSNENIFGLMTVWSEIKHNYPYQSKLDEIKWDEAVLEYIERTRNATTIEEFYMILMEFTSLVNDGHTSIVPPWEYIVPNHSKPAIEVEVIEGKVLITRIGNKKENIDNNLLIGDEILSIDDVPVFEKLRQINKIYARGSEQADNTINMFYLLMGPISNDIKLQIKSIDGTTKDVVLQRLFVEDNGNYFLDRIIDLETPLEIKPLGEIVIIKIKTFRDKSISEKVKDVIYDKSVHSIIFDLRSNMGGNDKIAYEIISSLINREISSPIFKYKTGSPALRNWGIKDEWKEHFTTVQPIKKNNIDKDIYILTNGATSSTAEDFVIALKSSNRATIVGTKTAGSSGNPYSISLPYGGKLRVSTFVALTPENVEYVGIGIDPDFYVKQTRKELINGIDSQLNFTIKLIKNANK